MSAEMSQFMMGDETYESAGRTAYDNGYVPRDYEQTPYGSVENIPPGEVPTIPMVEWPDRIADLERNKATLKDIWAASKIGVLNQGTYPFCHGFAAIMAVLIHKEKQGLPYVPLSASSVAAPVTNYTKSGAWIGRDLKQIVNVGVAPLSLIPMLTHSRSDFPSGWEQEAKKHKVTEFAELKPRDFLQQGSALLQGFAVSVGQNFWSHAVVQLNLRDLDNSRSATDHNRYGVEIINSWGLSWGDKGFAVQTGSKKFADESYIAMQVTV